MTRTLFFLAAAFNWAVALTLAIPDSFAWRLLGVAQPEQKLFLHLFLVMVAAFGFAYFWIGLEPRGKFPLIVFSVVGKLSVFVTMLASWLAGAVPTGALPPAVADLVFALLFLRAALRLRAAATA